MKKLLKNKVAMVCAFVLCGMVSFGLGYGSGGSDVTEARAAAEQAEARVERVRDDLARSERLADERMEAWTAENGRVFDVCNSFREAMFYLRASGNAPSRWAEWNSTGVERCEGLWFPSE